MTKTFLINGKEYTFECAYREVQNGFSHDCKFYCDNTLLGKTTCHYLNRTWERYEYQQVMLTVCHNVMGRKIRCAKKEFLNERGYKIMTRNRTEEFYNYLDGISEITELCEIFDSLR